MLRRSLPVGAATYDVDVAGKRLKIRSTPSSFLTALALGLASPTATSPATLDVQAALTARRTLEAAERTENGAQ